MTESDLAGGPAKPGMPDLPDVASLVEIQPEATVSRTVLKAEGARVVPFSFDAGQVLTEHTAAVPALLQMLHGHLRITADSRTVDLRRGGLIHLGAAPLEGRLGVADRGCGGVLVLRRSAAWVDRGGWWTGIPGRCGAMSAFFGVSGLGSSAG